MPVLFSENQDCWMVKDEALSAARCYNNPRSATVADLLVTILGIGEDKAQQVIDKICFQQNLFDESASWQRLRQSGPLEMKEAGLTEKQIIKLQAAIEIGRRTYLESPKKQQPIIDDPAIAATLLASDLMWQALERFAVIALDIKGRVIGYSVVAQGTKTECIADPKEIFGWLLRVGATRAIIAHNHPSGSLDPSLEDISLTRLFIQAGQTLSLSILDHLILGNGDYRSLRQSTNLWAGSGSDM
ncbi:MAG: RadC family protein [Spirulina sp.]